MTECTPDAPQVSFPFFGRRRVTVTFDDGHISADAGLLLIRQLDDSERLTRRLADALGDWRLASQVVHSLHDLVRERVYGICQGYEDGNDAAAVRTDPLFKAACDRGEDDPALASQPTLSRFENRAAKKGLDRARWTLVEHYIDRHRRRFKRPRRLMLDLDTTDDPTHGQQEFAQFNGFYYRYCYQHLLIHTVDGDLLYVELLPGKGDARQKALTALQGVVKRLRAAFPGVELAMRADSGFACPALYDFCEDEAIEYTVNVGTHRKMVEQVRHLEGRAEALFQAGGGQATAQVYDAFEYRAKTWRRPRRIVAKVQRTPVGLDTRLLVTSSGDEPALVYAMYGGRGQEENWIKDLKLGLKSDRLSCSAFAANELRLLLFAVAYQLMHELRRRASKKLRRARLETIRLRVLRVPARVKQTARRLWVRLSETFPWRQEWIQLARAVGATAT